MEGASISLSWLVNIIVLLLIAVAAYFLKKVGDTVAASAALGYEHDKQIALLKAEQVVQNTRLDQNEKDIDKGFITQTVSKTSTAKDET